MTIKVKESAEVSPEVDGAVVVEKSSNEQVINNGDDAAAEGDDVPKEPVAPVSNEVMAAILLKAFLGEKLTDGELVIMTNKKEAIKKGNEAAEREAKAAVARAEHDLILQEHKQTVMEAVVVFETSLEGMLFADSTAVATFFGEFVKGLPKVPKFGTKSTSPALKASNGNHSTYDVSKLKEGSVNWTIWQYIVEQEAPVAKKSIIDHVKVTFPDHNNANMAVSKALLYSLPVTLADGLYSAKIAE
jgi:hypothetical protein